MKRIITTLVLALVAVFAIAQNRDIPAGIRMEVTEAGEDDEREYSIFTYKDEDGTFGYYLSLGREFKLLEILSDDSSSSLSHLDEACLWLGKTADEAAATLDSFLDLLDEPVGTVKEFPCRLTNGAEKLTDHSTAVCFIVKRFLQGKRLCFHFTAGRHTGEVDLTKSAIKSLRWSFNLARKIHSDMI